MCKVPTRDFQVEPADFLTIFRDGVVGTPCCDGWFMTVIPWALNSIDEVGPTTVGG
jgi:hypothetical protein